jgi:tetratricopeptide (TPR) repeat protein
LYKRGSCYDKIGYIEKVLFKLNFLIKKAIGDYSRAVELEPKHFNALYARAACYIKLEHFELAMNDYDCAMAHDMSAFVPRKSPVIKTSPEKSVNGTLSNCLIIDVLIILDSTAKSVDTPIFFLAPWSDTQSTKKTLNVSSFETPTNKSNNMTFNAGITPIISTTTPLYSTKGIMANSLIEQKKPSPTKRETYQEELDATTKKILEAVNLSKLRGETERSVNSSNPTPVVVPKPVPKEKNQPVKATIKEPVVETNPFYVQGIKEKELGNYQQAISLLQKAIKHNPKMINAHINIASCYEVIGEVQLAIKSYTTALEVKRLLVDSNVQVDTGLAVAHFKRGLLYHTCEQHLDAVSDFTKAIEIAPNSVEYFYQRGLCFTHVYVDFPIVIYFLGKITNLL